MIMIMGWPNIFLFFPPLLLLFSYVVGDNRVLFMFTDGAKAWDARDFLVKQDRCAEVTIEGQNFKGKGASSVSIYGL